MAKPHRGKGIRELFAHGRGECPLCKRNNVKVLYEVEAGEAKIKICKTCKAAVKNGTKTLPTVAKAPVAEPAKTEAAPAPAEKPAEVTETEKSAEPAETASASE